MADQSSPVNAGAPPDEEDSEAVKARLTFGSGSITSSSTVEDIKNALYKYCASESPDTIFSQNDLLATSIIPDQSLDLLHKVTTALTKSGHLRLMQKSGTAHWRVVTNITALRELDKDAAIVYSHIESAGREGIWSSSLNRRTNLHKVVMDKAIKALEHKRLIKTVSNYRYPNRKTYMLWGLQPREDITGGPFFADGELDDEFVRIMCSWIERWVVERSWWTPPDAGDRMTGKKRKHRPSAPGSKQEAEAMRAASFGPVAEGGEEEIRKQREEQARPFPPGYVKYPSIGEITNAVKDEGIANTTMKIADIQSLVDLLVWDGKFERLKKRNSGGGTETVYRSVQRHFGDDDGTFGRSAKAKSPLTEAPCGRCPVFEFCEEGGLVNARTCPYFQAWLKY